MDALKTILLAGAGVFVASKVYELLVRPRFGTIAQLPGPTSGLSPFLGFFSRAEDLNFIYDLCTWREQFGPTLALPAAFGAKALMTDDPRALQHVTVAHAQNFGSLPLVARFLANALGRGLLTAVGSEHRRQRRILSPAFADAHVRALASMFRTLALVLAARWDAETARGPAELDVHDWMTRYTFDAIALGGFGAETHTLDPDARGPNKFASAIKAHLEQSVGSSLAPLDAALPFLKWLPTARRRIIDTNEAFVYAEARKMIGERKAAIDEGQEKRDILSVLIRANTATDVKPEERLSDQNIAEQVALFMAAGHETGTNVMSFALWNLVLFPRVQNKLRAELRACAALAPDAPADACTAAVLAGLPYLDAVTNKMMRLRPGEHFGLMRAARADDVVPLATPVRLRDGRVVDAIPMRKGDIITMPSRNMDPALWGADARDCRPERWEQLSAEAERQLGWNHLSTFGQGSRNCIGFRFAIIEFKACLATIVREFVLSPGPRTQDVETRIKLLAKPYVKGDPHAQLPLLVSRYEE